MLPVITFKILRFGQFFKNLSIQKKNTKKERIEHFVLNEGKSACKGPEIKNPQTYSFPSGTKIYAHFLMGVFDFWKMRLI